MYDVREELLKSARAGTSRRGKTELVNYLSGKPLTRSKAIKAKCYDCNGLGELKICESDTCPLYPYSPYRLKSLKPPKTAILSPKNGLKTALIQLLLIFSLFLTSCELAFCAEPPANLWKGLIGEATSEGYQGMYAVCHVYKNRLEAGMPLGCIALKRKDIDQFCEREGEKQCQKAREIVEKVFNGAPDITNGATHYENIEKYGVPYWAKNMKVVAKIGKHTFWRAK